MIRRVTRSGGELMLRSTVLALAAVASLLFVVVACTNRDNTARDSRKTHATGTQQPGEQQGDLAELLEQLPKDEAWWDIIPVEVLEGETVRVITTSGGWTDWDPRRLGLSWNDPQWQKILSGLGQCGVHVSRGQMTVDEERCIWPLAMCKNDGDGVTEKSCYYLYFGWRRSVGLMGERTSLPEQHLRPAADRVSMAANVPPLTDHEEWTKPLLGRE
jgi:hypothetical protein